MDLGVKGKRVLITGGTRGIGKAITEIFVTEQAKVGIVARNKSELLKVHDDLGVQIYEKDLSKANDRKNLMTEFITCNNGIDILINNVGASHGGSIINTHYGIFEEAMQLNFISAVHLSQLAIQNMKVNQEGTIVNISSIYGREAGGNPTYNASKAALISFTKSLSKEAIKDNIRVNGIAPGAIFHLNEVWKKRIETDPQYLEKYAKERIPAGRLGNPEEIANVVAFLASNKSSWIVGATINVDGGQSHLNF